MTRDETGDAIVIVTRRLFSSAAVGSSAPAADAEDTDGDDDFRRYVKAKVTRARFVHNDKEKQRSQALLCWTSPPLDHLLARTEHLDEQGGGLKAVMTERSPFEECRRGLLRILEGDLDRGSLAPVFHHYGGDVQHSSA